MAMHPKGFDCIVGNPPYVRFRNLDELTQKDVTRWKVASCEDKSARKMLKRRLPGEPRSEPAQRLTPPPDFEIIYRHFFGLA